jgi:4'-phosphopantetheinyl transferase EntD
LRSGYSSSELIEEILPDGVASAEAWDDPPDAVLYPGEAELISRAVDKRRREFRTARHCARRALRQLGLPPVAVLRGERGEPQWPPGVVGSLTHCSGYRAAAVAPNSVVCALGIDAEPNEPLPAGVLDTIALTEDQRRLAQLAAADQSTCWDRLLFCAKEAVYKAWFPLTHRWLGFDDATVTITVSTVDPGRGSFAAGLLVPGVTHSGHPLTQLDGHWLRSEQLLITAIALSTAQLR